MILTTEMILDSLRENLNYLRDNYRVQRVALFGSFVTGKATPESDIDLMIEFQEPIGLDFMELCNYLEDIFGRKVDVLTPIGLESIRIASVMNQIKGQMIYV